MARDKYDVNEENRKGRFSFLLDTRKGELLGRTPGSWALIIIFYIIYYSLLAGFFIGMIKIFFIACIDDSMPRLTGVQSLLRGNPGLSFLPKPSVEATIVKASIKNGSTYFNSYMSNINGVLAEYDVNALSSKQEYCENGILDDVSKACYFNLTKLGNCVDPESTLLSNGSICVYAKMNKIFGWLPDISDISKTNHTLISCGGQNPGDNENMGKVKYSPSMTFGGKEYGYFDSKYFPYLQQEDYMTPLVGLEFPDIKKNIIVLVKCELSNIKFSRMAPVGSGRFEIFVGTQ